MKFSEEEKRMILNLKTHNKAITLTRIYNIVRPGANEPGYTEFDAILKVLEEDKPDFEYITEYDLKDRILRMKQDGISAIETFRILLSEGYVISENDIRKVRGEELIKEDNGSGRLKKQTQKNPNKKEKIGEEIDLDKLIEDIRNDKIRCSNKALGIIVYEFRKREDKEGKKMSYEEISEWMYKNLSVIKSALELYMLFDQENKRRKTLENRKKKENKELAKEILKLIKSRNATLEQIQIMAQYYGVDLEEVMNTLEER